MCVVYVCGWHILGIDAGMIGSAAPVQERRHDDDVDDDYDSTPLLLMADPFIRYVTVTYEHVCNFQ